MSTSMPIQPRTCFVVLFGAPLSASAMSSRRTELVARVEHHPVAVDDPDPAGSGQLRARVDAGDLAPAQPDQLHRAGSVVQLALQGRYAAARAERDGPQRAVQRDHLPIVAAGDGARAAVLREVLEDLRVLLVTVSGQPTDRTLPAPRGFVATHSVEC